MTTDHRGADLIEAYHAVYDHKDKLPGGSRGRYLAYEAAGKIAELIETLGFTAPRRFDFDGRPADQPATWLTLDESDGVEVLAALALVGQIYSTTGDKVVSAHYMELYNKLTNATRR